MTHAPQHRDAHSGARQRMCDAVRAGFEATAKRIGIAQPDAASMASVMAALACVPRHRFVPPA